MSERCICIPGRPPYVTCPVHFQDWRPPTSTNAENGEASGSHAPASEGGSAREWTMREAMEARRTGRRPLAVTVRRGKNPYGAARRRRLAKRDHERYLAERKTGMEPWFEFWARVSYALSMIRIEGRMWRKYYAGAR